jgi:hypothetical protein
LHLPDDKIGTAKTADMQAKMRHHCSQWQEQPGQPGAADMILVEVALAWLVLSVVSAVVTAALGRAAARGSSQDSPPPKARLDEVKGSAHASPIESRLAAQLRDPAGLVRWRHLTRGHDGFPSKQHR